MVVAVGVGVMSGIEPVAGEVFPMPRRGEEIVNLAADRVVKAASGNLSCEGLDGVDRGGKPREVVVKAAQE